MGRWIYEKIYWKDGNLIWYIYFTFTYNKGSLIASNCSSLVMKISNVPKILINTQKYSYIFPFKQISCSKVFQVTSKSWIHEK